MSTPSQASIHLLNLQSFLSIDCNRHYVYLLAQSVTEEYLICKFDNERPPPDPREWARPQDWDRLENWIRHTYEALEHLELDVEMTPCELQVLSEYGLDFMFELNTYLINLEKQRTSILDIYPQKPQTGRLALVVHAY